MSFYIAHGGKYLLLSEGLPFVFKWVKTVEEASAYPTMEQAESQRMPDETIEEHTLKPRIDEHIASLVQANQQLRNEVKELKAKLEAATKDTLQAYENGFTDAVGTLTTVSS